MANIAKIVIAGLARNCSSTLATELKNIEKAFKNHHVIRTIIVESDSTDHSSSLLKAWSNDSNKNSIFLLGQLINSLPRRSERLAHCRNVYMSFLEEHNFFQADYLFKTAA